MLQFFCTDGFVKHCTLPSFNRGCISTVAFSPNQLNDLAVFSSRGYFYIYNLTKKQLNTSCFADHPSGVIKIPSVCLEARDCTIKTAIWLQNELKKGASLLCQTDSILIKIELGVSETSSADLRKSDEDLSLKELHYGINNQREIYHNSSNSAGAGKKRWRTSKIDRPSYHWESNCLFSQHRKYRHMIGMISVPLNQWKWRNCRVTQTELNGCDTTNDATLIMIFVANKNLLYRDLRPVYHRKRYAT